jgi:hypothetical protein
VGISRASSLHQRVRNRPLVSESRERIRWRATLAEPGERSPDTPSLDLGSGRPERSRGASLPNLEGRAAVQAIVSVPIAVSVSDVAPDVDPERGFNRVTSVAVLIGVIAAIIAGATIWLLLTDPVTVANAVDTGDVSPLVRQLAEVLYKAIAGLLEYL